MLSYNISAVFPDAAFRDDSSDAGCRINVGITSDHRARVKYCVAADLNVVSEHGAEFLDTCLDLLSAVMDYYQLLIRLDIGCDGAGSHVSMESENRISDVIIMWRLYMVKQNNVFKFNRIAYYAVCAYKGGSSYERAVSYFRIRPDDAWSSKICAWEHLSCLVHPYVLAHLFILFRVERWPELQYELLDALESFPRIYELREIVFCQCMIKVI